MRYLFIFLFISILISPYNTNAQLIVTPSTDAQQMVTSFFGSSIYNISNFQMLGDTNYRGTFTAINTNLGIDSGIILTNGDIALALGPNDSVEVGIFDGNGLPGDNDLTAIAGYPTEDASVLEFDFTAASDTLIFHYVFGSEEYPEWVGQLIYNDVFAILLDGVNIALLPDSAAVSVNGVNCFSGNPAQYICNDPLTSSTATYCGSSFNCPDSIAHTTIQYDGFTVPLTAIAVLTPGTNHHLKIGIADASDNGADAGAFISVAYSEPIPQSIANVFSTNKFLIYPNPNNGEFHFAFTDNTFHTLHLTDLTGKEIWSSNPLSNKGTITLPEKISSGSYFLIDESASTPARTIIFIAR